MKKRKALTLIEVLIALSILAIVMGILFPFFIRTFKGYNNTAIKSELQNEAENAIRIISKLAMEGKAINSINSINVENSFETYKIDGTSHNNIIEILSGEDKIDKLYLDKEVLYKISKNESNAEVTTTIGEYVNYLEISPLGGLTFKETTGIKVVVGMKKKEFEYKISSIIYFRNKK